MSDVVLPWRGGLLSRGTLTVTGMSSDMTTIGLVKVFVFIMMSRRLSKLREVQASSGNIHYKEKSGNVRTRSRCKLWHLCTTILKEQYETHSWDERAYYNKQANNCISYYEERPDFGFCSSSDKKKEISQKYK